MARRCRPLLGTFVEITAASEAAIEAAFSVVARVHGLMSAHQPDSDVSRINRLAHREPVRVDRWTRVVLERANMWSKRSDGAFDVVRAGRAALQRGRIPRHPGQPLPVASHWQALKLEGDEVRFSKPACIDLGGIAKGLAVDGAVRALRRAGAAAGLINAGGDMAGFGDVAWPVYVVDPVTRRPRIEISLCNQALATSALVAAISGAHSGDHLIGRDERWISATVCAPAAVDADPLAKIVLSRTGFVARCLATAGARALRIGADGVVTALEEPDLS